MSPALNFSILDWLSGSDSADFDRETLASLSILAGPEPVTVTEVEDRIANTVRDHINVPAYQLAQWLLVNFWKLRWEPSRSQPTPDWLAAHSMAAIDGAHAWPALEFASDGEFVQLRLQAEAAADAAGIRYLRDVALDVPASDFEQAVTEFVNKVEARIAARLPGRRELAEIRDELAAEHADPALAAKCKLQALAGIDPGEAPAEWFVAVHNIARQAGEIAANDLIAVSPAVPGELAGVQSIVAAMRGATTSVRLDWVGAGSQPTDAGEPPWRRGERLAADVRARVSIPSGPVSSARLGELLDAALPLQRTPTVASPELNGGYRNGALGGRTRLLVPTARLKSQRFYLARLIGAASQLSNEHVLPVSKTKTALQKFERAFAAEFLCPWADLDAFTDESGTDDDGIAEAAAHFEVSELLVLSSLTNKRKVHRGRLLNTE